MASKILTSLLLLSVITFCQGAPFIFKSSKEASDWFEMMFASHVRIMEEDRAADEMACEYGSYWSGESCESCEGICRDLKSTLCTKACPVYAAETLAAMNYEKFSQQFVTSEGADNYKLYFYILSGQVGLLYVLVVVQCIMFVYKKCGGPVWKKLMSMLQTKQLKRKETDDKELENKEANVAADVEENLLTKKNEILDWMNRNAINQAEPIPENGLTPENGLSPENGLTPENGPTTENGPTSGSSPFTESLPGDVSAPIQESGNCEE